MTPLLEREPGVSLLRSELRNAHGGRAELLEKEKRYADAIPDWEQVIRLSDGKKKEGYQVNLAYARVRAGEHRKAWTVFETLRPHIEQKSTVERYNLACVCGLAVQAVENDKLLTREERATLADNYGREGIFLLGSLFKALPKTEVADWRKQASGDSDIDSLRSRPDFPDLLVDYIEWEIMRPSGFPISDLNVMGLRSCSIELMA
jgi:hypothetical protein